TEYGVRLHIQQESLQPDEIAGPVYIVPGVEFMEHEGKHFLSAFKIHAYPFGKRFVRGWSGTEGAHLHLDVQVASGSEYETLEEAARFIAEEYKVFWKQDSDSEWRPFPEEDTRVIEERDGSIYLRALIPHFTCWGWFKKTCPTDPYDYARGPADGVIIVNGTSKRALVLSTPESFTTINKDRAARSL
ncbi:unnamed protein product, partial [Discosporangium mesarthrocarpum]